jgi:hypothetical protein
MDLFPSSSDKRKTPTLLGPLERANLSQWTLLLQYLRQERDPVSEMLRFILPRVPEDGQRSQA